MLIEAPEPHSCELPPTERREERLITLPNGTEVLGERRVELTLRSLYKCEECEQGWILVPGDWGTYWVRLRWYHRTTVGENLTAKEQRRRNRRRELAFTAIFFAAMFTICFLIVLAAMASS